MVLDPDRGVALSLSGEHHEREIRAVLDGLLDVYDGHDGRSFADLPPVDEFVVPDVGNATATATTAALSFPAKVAAVGGEASRTLLCVADTGHHQIIVAEVPSAGDDGCDTAAVMWVVGSGTDGLVDGRFGDAQFSSPQGLLIWAPEGFGSAVVFVADTGNNAVRRLDLAAQQVTTVWPVEGAPPLTADPATGRPPPSLPWDLIAVGRRQGGADDGPDQILIAMAGSHEIWALDPSDGGACRCVSGTGREANLNHATDPLAACWAQPSGLCLDADRGRVLVADAESSSVRSLALGGGDGFGGVAAVAGGGSHEDDLFAFGFEDGSGQDAKFQHPLGLCSDGDGGFYVCDSFNDAIRCGVDGVGGGLLILWVVGCGLRVDVVVAGWRARARACVCVCVCVCVMVFC